VPETDSAAFPTLLAKVIVPVVAPLLLGAKTKLNGTLFPAAIVAGKLIPLTENSEFVVTTDDTVTLVDPEVNCPAMVFVEPTVTDPMLAVVGETARVLLDVPVPESGIVNVRLDPFERIVMEPVDAPLVLGTKKRVKVMLAPGASVTGGAIPLLPKALPLVFALDMARVALPVFVRISEIIFCPPTATLPKFTEVRLAATLPWTPHPFSEIDAVEFEALLTKAIVPVSRFTVLGTNLIEHAEALPTVSVSGNAGLARLYTLLLEVAFEIVRLALPVFFRVHGKVVLLPI
jgi:hypothetical protein